ncbi:Oxysterol-binding protein [Toxoplasma gondii TgCatPRC2]|uniref:Oxysterol-binding protein n=7 Tax=Toxoplasma gondii TaxID=5811 RepID=S7UHF7_TOXGG|nr:Oxysterol-binding protein [Toxoplasma gondii GT1]KAF4646154.1 Oxysterol-binding protein [Toxoplasma gondii]KFG35559.1 Oxysterol-binding protein [Toxoplasma gondii p89]KFH14323.1 Oxysterol-binding protein [Toxoplasma gondii MAS]KYK65892.1 Oxysterol-binding protein [Toxoplasma gondii TgCatPRC2]PUA86846.1 Oxysterol-binding protein [Toxoplasma gondii TgCATBr9]RQX68829.1 Oxysterol-binding protein [Toxoplasma gondii CAST]
MPIHNVVALHRGNGRTATGCEEITVETESAKKLDEVPTISPLQSFESCHSEGKQDDISSVGVPCIDYSSLPHALPENGTPLPELEDPHPPRLPPRNAPYTALPLPPSALWQENFVELLLPISHCLEQKRQTGGQWHGGDISREALDTREESSTERVDHQSDNTEKSFATACSNIAGEGVPNGKPPHPGQRYDTATTVAHKITDEFGRDLDSGFTANFVDAVNAVRQPRAERTSDIAATEDVRTSSEEGTESVEAKSFCGPPENGVETEEPYLRPCTLREIPQVIVPLARRRTKLPCAKPSSSNLSILKILKQVNSSDMRNFSLPINVNEPLSMLQRICEDFEYTNLLSIARTRATSTERLAYVTIFALSAYAGSMERCYKPFNPMLGETFECSHRGFNYIAEQVSHHPPVSAYHAAAHNGDFVCFGTVSPVLSIQGTHVDSCNSGTVTLRLFLPGGGFEDYTWRRPNTRVHNIIFGTMWMEWVGVMTITNHMTSEEAHVSFLPVTSSSSSKASAGSWLSSFQWNAPSANRNLTEPASPPIAQSRRRRSNSVASDSGGGGEAEEQEKVTLGSGRKNDASSRSVSASPPLDTKRGRMNCRSDSWLSKECAGRNGLRGQVLDRAGCPRFFIDGCWSKRLWLTRVGKGSYEEFKQRNRLIEPTTGMNRDQNSGSSPSFSRGGQTSTPQKATHTSRISGRHGSGVVPLQTSRQENGSPEMNFISQTDRTAAEVRVVPADKDQVQVCCEQTRKRDHPSVASTARSKDEADITWNDEDTFFVAWEATLKPPSAKMYYNMPVFAIELNELTEGSQPNPLVVKRGGWSGMAPTDSRFRPDLRKYEDGDSAGAQAEKLRLEEKQRATARSMKGGESAWRPLWFDKGINAVTGLEDWLYNGRYWPERTRPLATSGGMIQPTRGNYCSTHVELSRFAVCPDIY